MFPAAVNVIREVALDYAGKAVEGGINSLADWALEDVNKYGTHTRPPSAWERNPWRSGAHDPVARLRSERSQRQAIGQDNYDPEVVNWARELYNREHGLTPRALALPAPSKQHGPTTKEPFTGNPSYGRKRRRATTGSFRRKSSSRGSSKRRRVGYGRVVRRRRTTGKRSIRRTKRGYYRGVKRTYRRRSGGSAKKSRRSTWLPPRVPLPSRSASSTYEPVDRYRAIAFTGTTLNTLFYKSPLQQINSLLGTTFVANLATKAAAEFVTRYRPYNLNATYLEPTYNANAKYPTGISVIQRLKLTFLPVMQLPGFVRVYAVYHKEFPGDSDRVFSTDYTTAVANAGVPQNVQANDFPYVSATSNYYTQPHVSIKELSYLWKNWTFKKVATIKVGPGIKIKPLVFTSRLTHFNFSDLNYGGYGTPATCPKNSVKFVVETVGCNVLQDSSTGTDASIWYGPGYFKTICKQEIEAVYRPTWQHAPSISSSPTVLSITKATAGLREVAPFPMKYFGAPTQITQHSTTGGAVVGSNAYYVAGAANDGAGFFETPVRLPDWSAAATGYATGAFDEPNYDKGMGVTANALKTAAT